MEQGNKVIIRWGIMLTLAAFVTLGTFHKIFALGAFVFLCGAIGLSDLGQGMLILTFLVPFAGIFKLSPNSTSLYTYAILLYCCRLIWESGYFQPSTILFTLYIFMTPFLTLSWNEFHYLRAIKLCCYLVMLYYVFSSPKIQISTKELFCVFISAVLLSSFVRLMDSSTLRILDFIANKTVGRGYEEARFAGLFDDPNYYTVNVIIAACLAVIMYHKNWINLPVFAILFGMLGYFLVITYSKSAFVMAFFPMIGFVWSAVKKKNGIIVLTLFFASFFLFSFLWFGGRISFFKIVLERFSGNRGNVLDNLTTGRLSIWVEYIEYMLQKPMQFVFGYGVKIEKYMVNHHAPHNTYLEALYSFGVVGSLLLGWILYEVPNLGSDFTPKRNFLNYIVVISMAAMYLFIHETYTPEVLFHFVVGYTALKMDMKAGKDK